MSLYLALLFLELAVFFVDFVTKQRFFLFELLDFRSYRLHFDLLLGITRCYLRSQAELMT